MSRFAAVVFEMLRLEMFRIAGSGFEMLRFEMFRLEMLRFEMFEDRRIGVGDVQVRDVRAWLGLEMFRKGFGLAGFQTWKPGV